MSIDKIKNIGLDKLVTQVYDFDSLTTDELMCKFAQKINIIIEHFKYLDDRCYNSDKNMELKLQYLLGQGLEEQVAKRLLELINNGTLGNLINQTLLKDINDKVDNIQKQADIPTYNLKHITEEMGISEGIQHVFDLVNETGTGRILLDRVYEIDKPLILERTNTNTNTSIEIYGGGCIKKSSNFVGDRLLLIKIGYHDEDNIIFNNISFDGVDSTVNGVDTFDLSLAYNLECSDKAQHNESKFVKFNDCSFNNCYCGVRLSSLSWVFNSCLFEFNKYGLYLDCSANANSFFGCSIRRNTVGVKIKQFDSTIGTISNSFYNCTIESNKNLGVISKQSQHTKLIGCYFENNGTNIDSNFEKQKDNKSCHILLNDAGGAGGHTIDSFFNTADYNISGVFLNSLVKNSGKIEIELATDVNFINQYLDDITFKGYGAYISSFILNGEKYKSTSDTKIIYKENEVPQLYLYKKAKDYSLKKTSNITTNSCNLCNITIDAISNGFIDFNAILLGRTTTGNNVSTGLITGKIGLIKATNGTDNYTACVSGLKFINCDGAPSGGSGNTQKLFTDGVNISVTNELNTVSLTLNGIDTTAMANWGSITKIDINVFATYSGLAAPKESSFEVITLS